MVRRSCDRCRRPYDAQRATSRYCSPTCRKLASKDRHNAPQGPEAPVVQLPAAATEEDGPTVISTRAELGKLGRLESPQGQSLLVVARRIDGAKFESGSSLAALVKTLDATLDRLAAGAKRADDPVEDARDELAARRARAGA